MLCKCHKDSPAGLPKHDWRDIEQCSVCVGRITSNGTVWILELDLPRAIMKQPRELASGARPRKRDFVEQHYVALKQANADFPILIRECSGVEARLWARYDLGKERSVSLDNMSLDQVAQSLHTLAQAKP